jgi:hypothetical protein
MSDDLVGNLDEDDEEEVEEDIALIDASILGHNIVVPCEASLSVAHFGARALKEYFRAFPDASPEHTRLRYVQDGAGRILSGELFVRDVLQESFALEVEVEQLAAAIRAPGPGLEAAGVSSNGTETAPEGDGGGTAVALSEAISRFYESQREAAGQLLAHVRMAARNYADREPSADAIQLLRQLLLSGDEQVLARVLDCLEILALSLVPVPARAKEAQNVIFIFSQPLVGVAVSAAQELFRTTNVAAVAARALGLLESHLLLQSDRLCAARLSHDTTTAATAATAAPTAQVALDLGTLAADLEAALVRFSPADPRQRRDRDSGRGQLLRSYGNITRVAESLGLSIAPAVQRPQGLQGSGSGLEQRCESRERERVHSAGSISTTEQKQWENSVAFQLQQQVQAFLLLLLPLDSNVTIFNYIYAITTTINYETITHPADFSLSFPLVQVARIVRIPLELSPAHMSSRRLMAVPTGRFLGLARLAGLLISDDLRCRHFALEKCATLVSESLRHSEQQRIEDSINADAALQAASAAAMATGAGRLTGSGMGNSGQASARPTQVRAPEKILLGRGGGGAGGGVLSSHQEKAHLQRQGPSSSGAHAGCLVVESDSDAAELTTALLVCLRKALKSPASIKRGRGTVGGAGGVKVPQSSLNTTQHHSKSLQITQLHYSSIFDFPLTILILAITLTLTLISRLAPLPPSRSLYPWHIA